MNKKSGNALVLLLVAVLIAGIGFFIFNSANSNVILGDQTAAVGSSSGSNSPKPIVSLRVIYPEIKEDPRTYLSWDCSMPPKVFASIETCTGTYFDTGNRNSGTFSLGVLTPTSQSEYRLTAVSDIGTSDYVNVSVKLPAPPVTKQVPPTLTLSASPTSVLSGKNSVTIMWSSTSTQSCAVSFLPNSKATSGYTVINNLTSSTEYSAQCTGKDGITKTSVSKVKVTVKPAASGFPCSGLIPTGGVMCPGTATDSPTKVSWSSSGVGTSSCLSGTKICKYYIPSECSLLFRLFGRCSN